MVLQGPFAVTLPRRQAAFYCAANVWVYWCVCWCGGVYLCVSLCVCLWSLSETPVAWADIVLQTRSAASCVQHKPPGYRQLSTVRRSQLCPVHLLEAQLISSTLPALHSQLKPQGLRPERDAPHPFGFRFSHYIHPKAIRVPGMRQQLL